MFRFTPLPALFLASSLLLSACQGVSAPDRPPITPNPTPEPTELTVTLSASATEGVAPLEVVFDAEANGYTPDFRWDFGDGSEILFGSATQTHVYTGAGSYTASVGVGGSEDMFIDTIVINVR